MTQSRLHRAALWYAQHGWQVFPLRPRTKEPFARLGVYNATSDTAQLNEWWQRWPQANIGLHCGGSGILALDADAYKDTYAADGFLTPEDEQTITNLTGNGGSHLLYRMPEGARYGNATGRLPNGVDIRGYGGYIVLPPSVHPNGNLYQWEAGYGPHEIDMLPLPEWLDVTIRAANSYRLTTGPADSEAVEISCEIVETVLGNAGIKHTGRRPYGAGRKWLLRQCPFNPPNDPHPNDRAAFVIVLPDGKIGAGCHHARCRQVIEDSGHSGWQLIASAAAADIGGEAKQVLSERRAAALLKAA